MGNPDTISDADLAARLTTLRDDPSQWGTALGKEILAEARTRYASLATAAGLDPSDGATHAWQFWTQEMTDRQLAEKREGLWSFTGGAIRHGLRREATAHSRLTSTDALRRSGTMDAAEPVRFHTADELSPAAALTVDPFEDRAEAPAPVRGIGGRQGIAAVRQLLVMAGLTPAQRDLIFEDIARHLTESASTQSAADKLRRSVTPSVPLGDDRWKALVSLVLGSPKGAPGIVQLIGHGHPAPMSEPHIQKLVPVFLGRLPGVAAGVA